MDKNIGKKLDGRYEITELIGVGGMADVYKGTDVIDNKPVAIKILKKEFAENEEFLRRFRNESKAIAVFSHPNIVRIYDVGFSEKLQYIIMEYIDGITLKEYIEEEKVLSWKDSVHFVIQILRALQHAHDKGVVHRDIKPQNIMMLSDGTIKVMDFGIAKFAREEGKTATDQAIGSVHYISPEQAKGDVTDERSDIYSVGVMLYEMLTGKKPFDSDNPVSIAVMHMHDIPERPRAINPDIPSGLEEIILKAMEKAPEDRYQSTTEMIKDIEAFKNNPEITFNYYTEDVDTVDNTKFFGPINDGEEETGYNNNPPVPIVPDNNNYDYDNGEYDDYEDEEDEEEERRSSLVVPVLTAVTIVVIIAAVFFVASLVHNYLTNDSNDTSLKKMPLLIGMDYNEAVNKYGQRLKIINEGSEYNEMQADCIFEQSIEEGTAIKKGTEVKVKVSLGMQTVKVPNVEDQNYLLAQRSFKELGLETEKREESSNEFEAGQVIRTEPEAGTEVEPGTKVILFVSMGKDTTQFKMDDLVGKKMEDAVSLCVYRGLNYVTETGPSYEKEGIVYEQSIPAGEVTEAGADIVIHISNGVIPEGSVPYTLNLPSDAEGRFELDFIIDGKPGVSSGTIVAPQMPSVTIEVPGAGESVNVIVTITNKNNSKTVTLGTYTFDFANKSFRAVSEDIRGSFEAIEGIYIPPTEAPTPEPTQAPPPQTEPPQTQPPQTEAPTQQPQDPNGNDQNQQNWEQQNWNQQNNWAA